MVIDQILDCRTYLIGGICVCLVKEKKHAATIARHSSMKSSAAEEQAFQQWRQAQDATPKRAKQNTPLMRCEECDSLSSTICGPCIAISKTALAPWMEAPGAPTPLGEAEAASIVEEQWATGIEARLRREAGLHHRE